MGKIYNTNANQQRHIQYVIQLAAGHRTIRPWQTVIIPASCFKSFPTPVVGCIFLAIIDAELSIFSTRFDLTQ